ncbi:MAG: HAD-IA family hydrolase [Hyphomicrobiaceae bacterium]
MKLVIFDCDGTIVDSQHIIFAAMAAAFTAHGLVVPPRETVLAIVGLSLVEAVERLLPGGDPGLIQQVTQSYRDAFGTLRQDPAHNEPLFPGARETLEHLARRGDVVLGVATGKSRRGVDRLFEREGLGDLFRTIQTADAHPSKPHPSMIQVAMAEVGALAERTVMVGDTTFDIEMALGAGAAAIGVTWGYHPPDALVAAGAHGLVEEYAHLVETVDRLLAAREEGA